METIHINLIGGNGVGKTTIAAEVFLTLQMEGYHCALIPDETKRLALSGHLASTNPFLVVAEQLRHQIQLNGKVAVTLCDHAPIISIMDMPPASQEEMVHVLQHITRDWIMLHVFVDWQHDYIGSVEGWGTSDQANWRHRRLKEFVQQHYDRLQVLHAQQVAAEIIAAVRQYGMMDLDPFPRGSRQAPPRSYDDPDAGTALVPSTAKGHPVPLGNGPGPAGGEPDKEDGRVRWHNVMAGRILKL